MLALFLGNLPLVSCACLANSAIESMSAVDGMRFSPSSDRCHVWTAEWGGDVAGVPVPW